MSNIAAGNKLPIQGCAKFETMPLKGKRNLLVTFIVLELFQEENDVIKLGQTNERMSERAEKGIFHTILYLSWHVTFRIW